MCGPSGRRVGCAGWLSFVAVGWVASAADAHGEAPRAVGCETAFLSPTPRPAPVLEPPPGLSLNWHRELGIGMFAAAAGDILSTEWGLRRPWLHEANGLIRDKGVRVTLHVVAPALVWYATEELRRKGRVKLAFWARVGVVAAYGAATVHNLRLASTR